MEQATQFQTWFKEWEEVKSEMLGALDKMCEETKQLAEYCEARNRAAEHTRKVTHGI